MDMVLYYVYKLIKGVVHGISVFLLEPRVQAGS